MPVEIAVADPSALVDRLVVDFEREGARARADSGLFSIAVPGGSVAVLCFPAIAAAQIDWSVVHVFWVDERAVPQDDPESNVGLARKLWLAGGAVPESNIHPMPADAPDLAQAASAYARELIDVLGSPVRIDFALLGVGPDGHIASLFPEHPAVRVSDSQLVATVSDAPKPPPRRLTLSMPVFVAARRVVVAAFGASKANALYDAIERDDVATPVAELLRRSSRALVLADREAGSRLSSRSARP
jgi:6-phosphogluconolactonase